MLSGPLSRDIAILSLRYPHIARYLLRELRTPQIQKSLGVHKILVRKIWLTPPNVKSQDRHFLWGGGGGGKRFYGQTDFVDIWAFLKNCAVHLKAWTLVLSFTQAHPCDTPFCNTSRDSWVIPHKNIQSAPKEQRRCHSEKPLSETVSFESPFCPLPLESLESLVITAL